MNKTSLLRKEYIRVILKNKVNDNLGLEGFFDFINKKKEKQDDKITSRNFVINSDKLEEIKIKIPFKDFDTLLNYLDYVANIQIQFLLNNVRRVNKYLNYFKTIDFKNTNREYINKTYSKLVELGGIKSLSFKLVNNQYKDKFNIFNYAYYNHPEPDQYGDINNQDIKLIINYSSTLLDFDFPYLLYPPFEKQSTVIDLKDKEKILLLSERIKAILNKLDAHSQEVIAFENLFYSINKQFKKQLKELGVDINLGYIGFDESIRQGMGYTYELNYGNSASGIEKSLDEIF